MLEQLSDVLNVSGIGLEIIGFVLSLFAVVGKKTHTLEPAALDGSGTSGFNAKSTEHQIIKSRRLFIVAIAIVISGLGIQLLGALV